MLIHAGAGGVGPPAIQLARRRGAKVIATASGDGIELARSLGADGVIDYRNEDFTARGRFADVVFDTVGGDTLKRSYEIVAPVVNPHGLHLIARRRGALLIDSPACFADRSSPSVRAIFAEG